MAEGREEGGGEGNAGVLVESGDSALDVHANGTDSEEFARAKTGAGALQGTSNGDSVEAESVYTDDDGLNPMPRSSDRVEDIVSEGLEQVKQLESAARCAIAHREKAAVLTGLARQAALALESVLASKDRNRKWRSCAKTSQLNSYTADVRLKRTVLAVVNSLRVATTVVSVHGRESKLRKMFSSLVTQRVPHKLNVASKDLEIKTAQLWVQTGEAGSPVSQLFSRRRIHRGGRRKVCAVAHTGDEELWLSEGSGKVRVVNLALLVERSSIGRSVSSERDVTCIASDQSHRAWTGHKDGSVAVWSVSSCVRLAPKYKAFNKPVRAIAAPTDGVCWVGAADGTLKSIAAPQIPGQELSERIVHSWPDGCACMQGGASSLRCQVSALESARGKVIAANCFGLVAIWHSVRECTGQLFDLGSLGPAHVVQMSGDGLTLLTAHANGVCVAWDVNSDSPVQFARLRSEQDREAGPVKALAKVSGMICVGHKNGIVRLFHASGGERGNELRPAGQVQAHRSGLRHMVSTSPPESECLITGGKFGSLAIWPLGELRAQFRTVHSRENSLLPSQVQHDVDGLTQIGWNQLEVIRRIGSGSYGEVHLARWLSTEVAVKVWYTARAESAGRDSEAEQDLIKQITRELSFLSKARHPNIVLLIGVCPNPLAVIQEYCQRGSLYDVLRRHANGRDASTLYWRIRVGMALNAATGMAFLHGRDPPVIHRDIKSSNLLVSKNYQVKVGDFGLSKIQSSTASVASMSLGLHSPRWQSPQVLQGHSQTAADDVYSFGIVLYEIASLQLPFEDLNDFQVLHQVVYEHVRPELPGTCCLANYNGFADFCNLMRECWAQEREDRPSFTDVSDRLSHLYQLALEQKA